MQKGPNPFEMPANHGDDTPVILSVDVKSDAEGALCELAAATEFLMGYIRENTLTKSIRFNGLYAAASALDRAKQTLGGAEDDAQTIVLRSQQLREANTEIRRIRDEMAAGVSNEAVGLKLYPWYRLVYDWWISIGFGFMEAHFTAGPTGGHLVGKFSCMLGRVTGEACTEEAAAALAAGVDMHKAYGAQSDLTLQDTPRTREWLIQQLQRRFPGAYRPDWEVYGGRSDADSIRYMTARIPVEALLPVPAVAAAVPTV